jgi:hypothetical protein
VTDPATRVLEFLAALDEAVPDLVTGLYLTGSTALGDVQPESDIDMIAILAEEPSRGQAEALRAVHAARPGRPYLDATYLSAAQFGAQPMDGTLVTPYAQEGVLETGEPAFELNPSTWVALARYGIAVRGPERDELGIHVDDDVLSAWNKANLRIYWRGVMQESRAAVATRDPAAPVPGHVLSWVVLGPPRLHYTIATGDVTSKTGAGEYALGVFPAYRDIIERALAARRGEPVTATTSDLGVAADYVDTVVADALSLPDRSGPATGPEDEEIPA